MIPSLAVRPARFSALAAPVFRKYSTALSRLPPVSSSAFLQSIMPAPVRSRSSFTSLGLTIVVISNSPCCRGNAAGISRRRQEIYSRPEPASLLELTRLPLRPLRPRRPLPHHPRQPP